MLWKDQIYSHIANITFIVQDLNCGIIEDTGEPLKTTMKRWLIIRVMTTLKILGDHVFVKIHVWQLFKSVKIVLKNHGVMIFCVVE